jgi:hypothetical protein
LNNTEISTEHRVPDTTNTGECVRSSFSLYSSSLISLVLSVSTPDSRPLVLCFMAPVPSASYFRPTSTTIFRLLVPTLTKTASSLCMLLAIFNFF